MGKYSTWILLFALAGTLSAVAAIAIAEAFVPATLLVLTTGEWELLAAVFYIIAVLLYFGEEMHSRRGVSYVGFASVKIPTGRRWRSARVEEQDATYVNTLEEATA